MIFGKTLSLFLFIVLTIPVQAQKLVTGSVSDGKNGDFLSGATVMVNVQIAVTTDSLGYFQLTVPDSFFRMGRLRAEVRYLGFETQEIWLRPGENNQVRLVENVNYIKDVVISAGKVEQELVRTTVSIQNIQPYLIRNRVTTQMRDLMEQTPGVNVTDGQINIRSGSGWSYGTGSRVSVLVDGMPLMDGGTGQVLWSFLPMENIDQVEVIKGAASVMYGSSALNGVVHFRTRKPGNGEISSGSMMLGVYDLPKKESWRWNGNIRRTTSGGTFLYGHGNKRRQYTLSGQLLRDDAWRMGDQDHRGRLSYTTRFYSKDNRWQYGVNGNIMAGRSASFLLWESYEMAYTALDSSFTRNKAFRVNVDPYFSYFGKTVDHHWQTRYLFVDNRIEPGSGDPDQSNSNQYLYTEYRSDVRQWEKWGLSVHLGAVVSYSRSVANMFLGTRQAGNLAGYTQLDYKWKDLDVSAGIRYEAYRLENYSEARPVGKLGLNYRLAKGSFVRASFGQGYRFPSVSESFIRTSAGPVQIFSNTSLKSEFGYNAEIGFRQVLKPGKNSSMLLDLAIYQMGYENMMEFAFSQWELTPDLISGFGFKSVNIGKARIRGFEISAGGQQKWGRNSVKYLLGYTFSDPRNRNPDMVYAQSLTQQLTYKTTSSDTTGTWLKYRSRHLIRGDVEFERTRWSVGISYRYMSRQEAIDRAFEQGIIPVFVPGVKQAREANFNGDHVVDLRAAWKWTGKWKTTLMIANLFNEEYMSRPGDMRPPRTINLQLSFNY